MTKESNPASKTILVCQGHTCSLSGSAKVLVSLQIHAPPEVTVIGCGCLGQCGNGPMVLFLPEETWYSGVNLDAVTMIIEQHLRLGKPVVSLLYRKFHPLPSSQHPRELTSVLGWLLALSFILALVLTVVWVLNANQY